MNLGSWTGGRVVNDAFLYVRMMDSGKIGGECGQDQVQTRNCNQIFSHTTFIYHIPVPVKSFQKNGKYQYDTGKIRPLKPAG